MKKNIKGGESRKKTGKAEKTKNAAEKAGLLWFIEGIMHINDGHLWEEWEHELDHRKEETSMYISLMERKGVEKGVKKGVEKEKLHMARRMLQAGESEEKILFYTEITPEELEELRKNLKNL